MNSIKKEFQKKLRGSAMNQTKAWWENYVKGAKFYGVKMEGVRKAIIELDSKHKMATTYSVEERVSFCLDLMKEDYTEEKLGGMIYMQEKLIKDKTTSIQLEILLHKDFPPLYSNEYLSDWNVCDWFSVKVLSKLYTRFGREFATHIQTWVESENMWQRRAAIVCFVNHAKLGDDGNFLGFERQLLTNCLVCLNCQERFAQTGAGWVLREMSKGNSQLIKHTLEDDSNLRLFTGEGLRYTIEKLPTAFKKSIKLKHKNLLLSCGKEKREELNQEDESARVVSESSDIRTETTEKRNKRVFSDKKISRKKARK